MAGQREKAMAIEIRDRVVLVTGANRGIGRALVEALLAAGARKVWAGARSTDSLRGLLEAYPGRVEPLSLDVTSRADVERAAQTATDTEVVINNAGIVARLGAPVTDPEWLPAGRQEMEVNVFGTLAVSQAFAPVLARNGGGAIVNVVSVAGLVSFPALLSYSLSKAALHSLTQALRALLRPQGTQVLAVYPGPVDTDMGAALPIAKTPPDQVARAIVAGLAAGTEEIFPDPVAQQLGAAFLAGPKALEQQAGALA